MNLCITIVIFRSTLTHQLELSIARADSEALARRIAEETVADLEKEKAVRELEIRESERRLRSDISSKDIVIMQLKEKENEYMKAIDTLNHEKEETNEKMHNISQGNLIL